MSDGYGRFVTHYPCKGGVSQSGAPVGVVSKKLICWVWCSRWCIAGCGVWVTKKKAFIFCLQVITIMFIVT
jgi:hypothetical protein